MSTARTRCWSCGETFFKVDRYCPSCGKDSWNPPQGDAAARFRPVIGPQTPGSSDASSTVASGTRTAQTYVADDRQTTIAAGVVILATLAAMSFWFWFAIGIIGAIKEPDFGGSYLSAARIWIAFAVAVVGTVATWMIARSAVDA